MLKIQVALHDLDIFFVLTYVAKQFLKVNIFNTLFYIVQTRCSQGCFSNMFVPNWLTDDLLPEFKCFHAHTLSASELKLWNDFSHMCFQNHFLKTFSDIWYHYFSLLSFLTDSVRFGIGASNRTPQEIQCLLYTNLLTLLWFK